MTSSKNARYRYFELPHPLIDESLVDTEFGTWLSNGLLAGKGCHCHLGPGVAITPVRTLGSTSGQQAGFPGGVRQILFYGRTHRNRCLACPHAQGPATFEEYLPCIPPQQGMLTLKCQTGEYKRTLPGHQSPGKGILKCELIHHHDLPDRRSNHYIAQKISSTLNVEEPFLLSPRQLELYHWLLNWYNFLLCWPYSSQLLDRTIN